MNSTMDNPEDTSKNSHHINLKTIIFDIISFDKLNHSDVGEEQ
jgi:hypothetical protein